MDFEFFIRVLCSHAFLFLVLLLLFVDLEDADFVFFRGLFNDWQINLLSDDLLYSDLMGRFDFGRARLEALDCSLVCCGLGACCWLGACCGIWLGLSLNLCFLDRYLVIEVGTRVLGNISDQSQFLAGILIVCDLDSS